MRINDNIRETNLAYFSLLHACIRGTAASYRVLAHKHVLICFLIYSYCKYKLDVTS